MRRILPKLWLLVPVAALVFLVVSARVRVQHIEHVSAIAGGAEVAPDPASPTGHAGGVRVLVVPEREARSLQWVMQTQAMLERGEWRLERVEYDNAPHGRAVWTASPYRWWLAVVAWCDSRLADRPLAASVERAALWADPLLHGLVLIVVATLLGMRAGPVAAAVGSLAVAGLFPFAAAFLPGRPDEGGLALACALLSVLPIAVELAVPARRGAWLYFLVSGAAGGLGLWVNANMQMMVVLGSVVGGCAAIGWARRRTPDEHPGPGAWRAWAVAGALVSVGGWWIEQPSAGWSLAQTRWDGCHPAYALAWLGLGEGLVRVQAWARHGRAAWRWSAILAAVVALGAVLVLPVWLARAGQPGFFGVGELLVRVSDRPGDAAVGGVFAWFGAQGLSLATVAAVLPIVVGLAVAGSVLLRRSGGGGAAGGVVFVLGPLLVALAGACFRPGDWTLAGAMLVTLVAPGVVVLREIGAGVAMRGWVAGATVGSVLAGIVVVTPRAGAGAGESVSAAEVQALIERDLAWWLARQAPEPGAIVLAPPDLTVALIYHGGLRGLGSPYRENEDGFRYSVRLAAATTPDEGQALVESRGVRYIVMPTWDDFLDEYARLGANKPEHTLVALLHQWQPPRWLRAIPYQMPDVEGFAEQSVAVFEVVDLQDNPTALSRLAEYFLETGRTAQAVRLAAALKELFPTEPAAYVARAQVAVARRDAGGFREITEAILPMLDDGSAETLTWDRRVSLALVLAQAKHADLALAQTQRCLDEMDEPALRSLTSLSLQRFLALLKTQGLAFGDAELERLANDLLPPELRAR